MSQDNEYENNLTEGIKLNIKELKSRLFQMEAEFDTYKNQKKYFVDIYDQKIKEKVYRDRISERLRKDYEEQKNEKKKRNRKNETKKERDKDSGKFTKFNNIENTLNQMITNDSDQKSQLFNEPNNNQELVESLLTKKEKNSVSSLKSQENLNEFDENLIIVRSKRKSKSLLESIMDNIDKDSEPQIYHSKADNFVEYPKEDEKIINLNDKDSDILNDTNLKFVVPGIPFVPIMEPSNKNEENKMDIINNTSQEKRASIKSKDSIEINNSIRKLKFSLEKPVGDFKDEVTEKSNNFYKVFEDSSKENLGSRYENNIDKPSPLKNENIQNSSINEDQFNLFQSIKTEKDIDKVNESISEKVDIQAVSKINSESLVKPSTVDAEEKYNLPDNLIIHDNVYSQKDNNNENQIFKPLDSSDKLYRDIDLKKSELPITFNDEKGTTNNINDLINTIPWKMKTSSFKFPTKEYNPENPSVKTVFKKEIKNDPFYYNNLPCFNKDNKNENINLFSQNQNSLIYTFPNTKYAENTNFFKKIKINPNFMNESDKFSTNIKRDELIDKSNNYFNTIKFNKDRLKILDKKESRRSIQNIENCFLNKVLRKSVGQLKSQIYSENLSIPVEINPNYGMNINVVEHIESVKRESLNKKEQKNIFDNNKKVVIKEVLGESNFPKTRDSLKSHLRSSTNSEITVKVKSKSILIFKFTVITTTVILSLYILLRVCHGNDLSSSNYFQNLFDFNSFSLESSNFLRILPISYLEQFLNPSDLISFILINFWKTALITLICAIVIRIIIVKRQKNYLKEIANKVYEKILDYLQENTAVNKVMKSEETLIGKFSKEFNIEEDEFRNKIFPLVREIAKDYKEIKMIDFDLKDNKSSDIFWCLSTKEDT